MGGNTNEKSRDGTVGRDETEKEVLSSSRAGKGTLPSRLLSLDQALAVGA